MFSIVVTGLLKYVPLVGMPKITIICFPSLSQVCLNIPPATAAAPEPIPPLSTFPSCLLHTPTEWDLKLILKLISVLYPGAFCVPIWLVLIVSWFWVGSILPSRPDVLGGPLSAATWWIWLPTQNWQQLPSLLPPGCASLLPAPRRSMETLDVVSRRWKTRNVAAFVLHSLWSIFTH